MLLLNLLQRLVKITISWGRVRWPQSRLACRAVVKPGKQYATLETLLCEMDGGFLTSIDSLCAITGAVFFWLAELNLNYINTIKERTADAKAVVPNSPVDF